MQPRIHNSLMDLFHVLFWQSDCSPQILKNLIIFKAGGDNKMMGLNEWWPSGVLTEEPFRLVWSLHWYC